MVGLFDITEGMTQAPSSTVPLAIRLALPALLLGAVGIAFAPIFVRVSEVGPISTAFWRLCLAMPALWLWMAVEDRRGRHSATPPRRPKTLRDIALLSLPGVFFAGDLGFWHLSITMTSVANATLLANFAPVFVTLFGWLLLGLRVTRTFVGGMVLALVGAITLMGESLTISGEQLTGDGLGIITAAFYAAYILAVGRLRATYSTATIMAWSAVSNTIVLLIAAMLAGETLWPATLSAWAVLVGLALVSHVGGQSLIAYALAHLPASFGSVSLLLQPAVAALLAWVLLAEPLSAWQGVGGLIILIGIVLARRGTPGRATACKPTALTQSN